MLQLIVQRIHEELKLCEEISVEKKEHDTKIIYFFQKQQLRAYGKKDHDVIKQSAAGYNNENSVRKFILSC